MKKETSSDMMSLKQIVPRGPEQPALKPSKTPISPDACTPGVQSETFSAQNDPDLALLVEAWPDLPEHIKDQITALVKSHMEADTHDYTPED